jgi:hypothetical protein
VVGSEHGVGQRVSHLCLVAGYGVGVHVALTAKWRDVTESASGKRLPFLSGYGAVYKVIFSDCGITVPSICTKLAWESG